MKKILISVMSLALVVGLLGAGAMAYFSDTESSVDNTFTAGALTMEIGDSDEYWYDGDPVHATWHSPDCWMPGQEFDAIVQIKNTGCSDILYLGVDLKNYSHDDSQGDGSDLAQVIEVVKFNKYIPGSGWGWYDNLTPPNASDPGYLSKVVHTGTTLSLEELIDSYTIGSEPSATNPGTWFWDGKAYVAHLTDFVHGNGYDGATSPPEPSGVPAIPAGTTYQLELGFKFMPSAGNEYQGDTCQFDIYFYGTQDKSTLP